MRSLFSPGICGQRRFALLAPRHAEIPVCFFEVAADQGRHDELMADMQRLRGRVYLQDGAIDSSHLTPDGRHALSTDEQSWHLLLLGEADEVIGCMRYLNHRRHVLFSRTGVAKSALAQCQQWGEKLRKAVSTEVARAAREGIGFGEAGGWAISEDVRCTSAALSLVLGIFGLAQLLGEAYVLSTATMRNGSARILQRLGGANLALGVEELPSYYDPKYGCEMQLLRFDSRVPSPKYAEGVAQIRNLLLTSPVLRSQSLTERFLQFNPALAGTHEHVAEATA